MQSEDQTILANPESDDSSRSDPIRPAEADPLFRCEERRERFIKNYGVKRFDYRPRNLLALLKQGGAPVEEVKRVLRYYFSVSRGTFLDAYGKGNPFDHNEMWGRSGIPIYLIGHPYSVYGDALETLNAIQRLGLSVLIHSASWYGYGTVQIQVYHYPTIARIAKEINNDSRDTRTTLD